MLKIFFDSSVIISAIISKEGASRQILTFCEGHIMEGWISQLVKEEISRNIKRKLPELQNELDNILKISRFKIIEKIPPKLLAKTKNWIKDKNDAHILAAAKLADVNVLLTLDIRHFIKDQEVAKKSNLQILTPGEFLKGFYKII